MASDMASQSQKTMQISGNSGIYPKFPTKKNRNYKIIIGFDKFIKYYYDTPHARCSVNKIFLLPIYIIKFY